VEPFEFNAIKMRLIDEKKVLIKIVSDSMEPLMKVGQSYYVLPHNNNFKRFEIIVFYQNQRLNCHFVWKNQVLFNSTLVTRSLKHFKIDDFPVFYENILGKIESEKISFFQKVRIIFYNFIAGS
jgi:hypothetical protein